MIRAFLLLGSNEGERQAMLSAARVRITLLAGPVSMTSSLYETAAWGNTDQPSFLNQVVAIETKLTPAVLLSTLQAIERSLGRVSKGKGEPRTIDIDILLYSDQIIQEPDLVVPHTSMAERRFALTPLAEIAPDAVHPVSKKTFAKMLEECGDGLAVSKI
jgi:2-amino-4-hydroxy-6-hydroxymethyldihydropteridine diphosphokinase